MKMTIDTRKRFLLLPVREEAPLVTCWIHQKEKSPVDLKIRFSGQPDFMTWMELAAFHGETVELSGDIPPEAAELMVTCDELPEEMNAKNEKYRPRFHYTPLRGWVNDPNGLYYLDGLYHIFYQHNPYDTRWENMHWGHAVSENLLDWREMPEALIPDDMGPMFSGSAVVDRNNVSGLGRDGKTPILLFYTAAGGINAASAGRECCVCIAWSLDGVRFEKYSGNPVLAPYVHDNRDPKVFFCDTTGRYCMVLYLDAHRFAIFSAADLIHWRFESEVSLPPLNECPDMFPLPGDPEKWVFIAGADLHWEGDVAKYYTGTFDGHVFKPCEGPYPIDSGRDMYSTQTFENAPDNRRIFFSWRSRQFDGKGFMGMPFNGEFTLPMDLLPVNKNGRTMLAKYPAAECLKYIKENTCLELTDVSLADKDSVCLNDDVKSAIFCMKLQVSGLLLLDAAGVQIEIDGTRGEVRGEGCRVPFDGETLELLCVRDRNSLEVYVNGGIEGFQVYCAEAAGKIEVSNLSAGKILNYRAVLR